MGDVVFISAPVVAPRITKQHDIHQNQSKQDHKTPGGKYDRKGFNLALRYIMFL